MGRLIYGGITSLDGYVNDADGTFDWAAPDEEVHAAVNDLERPVGTHLYGRRMYDVMRVWADPAMVAGEPDAIVDYADIWNAADKLVYSRTLSEVTTERTRLVREFVADEVAELKAAADRDLSIGGPGIAAEALRAGLVDEVWAVVCPVVVGGGTRFLPDDLRLPLSLADVRRFGSGVVLLQYVAAG